MSCENRVKSPTHALDCSSCGRASYCWTMWLTQGLAIGPNHGLELSFLPFPLNSLLVLTFDPILNQTSPNLPLRACTVSSFLLSLSSLWHQPGTSHLEQIGLHSSVLGVQCVAYRHHPKPRRHRPHSALALDVRELPSPIGFMRSLTGIATGSCRLGLAPTYPT
eukprot:3838821-Rhodomonas_salina.1